ncbi:hypothetical protein [Rhodoferax saidenbachensis]|uniref:Uncharacterized protein n=1 Tax=Rhodoferax saidenbachensis TaxID=1484693 RepID=A0A1P8KAJ7_9BURK|nr:hypothetical protein [Rhodoferax saidenbachensis]APW43034.1 hypothetical protein RS694_11155 [Rhodoferax saidenbachensis]
MLIASLCIALPLAALYLAFWLWYGGNGKPMTAEEKEAALRALQATDDSDHTRAAIEEVRELLASDDGKEFVMQNLVRYRPKALYPAGYHYSDDPREADNRYGKSIVWPLLRNGNLLLFIGRRTGNFVVPEGADAWHYVAMVRYRSRRDFVRFAIDANQAEKFVHKWAAIEKTHIFPVKPVVSLFVVRTLVALLLSCAGALLFFIALQPSTP